MLTDMLQHDIIRGVKCRMMSMNERGEWIYGKIAETREEYEAQNSGCG